MSDTCVVVGCKERLNNSKHALCRRHWGMDREGALVWEGEARARERGGAKAGEGDLRGDDDDELSTGEMLSSTRLGKMFGLPPTRVNLVLQELGWIERYVKGWKPTSQGMKLGAQERESKQRGVPYVVWPATVAKNGVLLGSINESLGKAAATVGNAVATTVGQRPEGPESGRQPSEDDDFRKRFPAQYRAKDGHLVRSRAELVIDNYLYDERVAHAVERRLPVEEDVYCDFYIPKNSVYVEFWGMAKDPEYAARMEKKKVIYKRNEFNLIELDDDDIEKLDDVLPKLLLKYGIETT